ncbi:MAG: plastocyanin/azurin family copper-binding protein [Betaproteobacteria bacterium]
MAVLWFPAAVVAATVSGTVSVEQAPLRTDGPKHDRDVVVILDRVSGGNHPMANGHAQMDQRGLVFIPHVLAIQKGSTVTFLNNDNDLHNVYFLDEQTGKTLDIGTWGPGVPVDHRFTTAGTVIVLCKLHLEMAAYIVVSDSPWFIAAQVDPTTRKASFSIKDVPAGEYRLSVWHKKLRPLGGPARVVVPQSGSVDVPVVLTTASRAGKSR